MQKARRHFISKLRPLVSVWFQVLFSPSYSEYFSPFLHSTGSLSVSQEYLALPDGAGEFPQGVSDLAVLRIPLSTYLLPVRSSHALWPGFPPRSGFI